MESSTMRLLQEPQQWRTAQLKAAKVQVAQGVPVTSLVEPHFITRDGDEGSYLNNPPVLPFIIIFTNDGY